MRRQCACFTNTASIRTRRRGKSSAARRRTGEEKLSGFARELFTGACGRLPEIDAILAASAENWRLHRIARVPLAVLRLAVYELLTAGAENERIIINEALEICRTYADEKAVAFVNGVLGKAADAVGSTRA